MTSTISPTVGRKVWFYGAAWLALQPEPQDATVIKVHPAEPGAEPLVNLFVIDPDSGNSRLEASVPVGDEHSEGRHYRWMPYQVAQAKQQQDVGTVATLDSLESVPAPAPASSSGTLEANLFGSTEAAPAPAPAPDEPAEATTSADTPAA